MNGSTKKSKRLSKKDPVTNEHENTTIQNLWDVAVLKGKLIAIQAYLKKEEKSLK